MADTDLTPMLRQYREIKAQHPDCILMYRIGDFYEMFFDDAVEASKLLDIVLTSRNKNDPNPIPLCGIPYHAVEPYIARLVAAGRRVAICDQVEDPKSAKGVVRREVTRVVTPSLNESDDASYLAAVFPGEPSGIAFLDLANGRMEVAEVPSGTLLREMRRGVREVVVPEGTEGDWGVITNRLPGWVFHETYARRLLQEQFGSLGIEGMPRAIAAAGAALHYARETQKVGRIGHLTTLRRIEPKDRLIFSEETAKSLDLEGVIALFDKTGTAMGRRRLRERFYRPLVVRTEIEERLEAVAELGAQERLAGSLRESVREVYDLERIAGRIALGRAGPRDLTALAGSLCRMEKIAPWLAEFRSPLFRKLAAGWDPLPETAALIEKRIVADPPATLQEGGVIADRFSTPLDELRSIGRNARETLVRIEERERQRTGIGSLKVRFNRVFGYYLEVTNAHLAKVPEDYLRKQTLTNAERFITPELKEFEEKVLGAEERIRSLERQLFAELLQQLAEILAPLQDQASRVAELDCLIALAVTARERNYVRPELAEEPVLEIDKGRHPLVEAALPPGRFVPNDIRLDPENRILLITGPNMAGKSTAIRQAGLILLLAQVGSFVPAARARIGIADRLFSRIGAQDRLASGQSTFMVEMTETAQLVRHATERSLILLDEVGRGTSTYDGLSIAWAVVEHLHDQVRARTLFATHYHELIDLERTRPGIRNFHAAVRDEAGEVVFLYEIRPGGMSHSYGIHVARLAGLPPSVIQRAQEVMQNLETGEYEPNGLPRIGKRGQKSDAQRALF